MIFVLGTKRIGRERTPIADQTIPTAVPFVTTAEFIEGTRRYRDAAGVFVATGQLNFLTGEAVGTYTLLVCHAR